MQKPESHCIEGHPKIKNLIGERYGKLLVESFLPGRKPRWVCLCDCGKRTRTRTDQLTRFGQESCGCDRIPTNLKHGLHESPECRAWYALRSRCRNPKNRFYRNYGGRGIDVCDRWNESFETFYADMGPRPTPKHSIDRINNDGNYEPGNCRWALPYVQRRNSRIATRITAFGETKTLVEWSESRRVSYQVLTRRIRIGWPPEKAISEPVLLRKPLKTRTYVGLTKV